MIRGGSTAPLGCSEHLRGQVELVRGELLEPETLTAAVAELRLADKLALGDLQATRDWSFAGDIVRGMWLMLQQERPGDYILASGIPHTVAELAEIAFGHVGLEASDHIRVDQRLVRDPEAVPLI